MRVAIVSDVAWPFWKGGGERRYYELAKRLGQRGHEVTFLTMHMWDGLHVTELAPNVRAVGISPDLGIGAHRSAVAMARWAAAVARIVPTLDADVIECLAFPYFAAYGLHAANRRRIPAVHTWHEYYGLHHWLKERPLFAPAITALERRATRLGAAVAAVSDYTAGRLRQAGVRAERLRVIPNGVDYDAIQRAEPCGEPYDVLYVGRLIRAKRLDLLLRAVSRLPWATVGVIGDGDYRAEYERLAAALGVGDRVTFLGRVEQDREVWGRMKRARVLAMPSEREGFSLVCAEANAAGLPVVAADWPGSATPSIVRSGGFIGHTAAPDPERYAEALQRALDNPLNPDACRRAAQQWDWERATDDTERLYRDLARAPDARRLPAGARP